MNKTISKLFILLSFSLILLSSCASAFELAGDALNKGNYTTSVIKSFEALDKDPGSTDAELILKEAWNRANQEWWDEIYFYQKNIAIDTSAMDLPDWVAENFEQSQVDIKDLEKTLPIYDKLINLHQIVENKRRYDLNPDSKSIAMDKLEIQQYIADVYYTLGCEKLELNDRESAREALSYFDKVKATINNYPNIEEKSDMAIQLATVKVALALHKNNDKINILQELADKLDNDRLIDIVNINDRSKSQFEARNIASQYGAEILVYFKTDTNVNSNITTNVRPLDSRVTAVKNWNIVSKALEVSTTTNVYYNVIELDSNTSIKETSFDVTSSTDFDFTLTKIDAKTKSEKIQLGDMEKASTLKIATIESGNDEMMLNSQLDLYEDISIQYKSPAIILTNLSDFHHTYFSKYDNIQELSKYKDLKNHVFIPFHLLEKNQGEYSTYSFIYNITYGEGNLGQILTTEVDIATYELLLELLQSKSFINNSVDLYLEETVSPDIFNKLNSQIYSLLQ